LGAPEAQDFTAEIELPAVDAVEAATDLSPFGIAAKRVTVHAEESAGLVYGVPA